MLQINSGNVIIDNTWLWRADHDVAGKVYNSNNPVTSGIVVNGDNVIAYGLAVEHTLGHMTVWNGNNGMTIFYQSEFPYDVDYHYGNNGYSGYKVGDHVTNHKAYGIGTYSFFRDHNVDVQNGIIAPNKPGIEFTNAFSRFLSGKGSIKHVINGQGATTSHSHSLNYVCHYGGHHMQNLQSLQDLHSYQPVLQTAEQPIMLLEMYPTQQQESFYIML